MEKKIRSVIDLLDPSEMGVTDAHSHIWISNLPLDDNSSFVLDKEDLIIEELKDYKEWGGISQLDCQPGGAGRDGNRLFSISRASGVNLVACTGFHLSHYYPPGNPIWSWNEEQAAEHFLDEIQNGLIETRISEQVVYPGFIKIAVRENLESSPINLLEGAAAASLESGYLIEMHTEKGAGAEDFLEFFMEKDLPAERLVFCHMDKRPDYELHMELAQEGCLLEYDTFFREKYLPENNLWPLLRRIIEAGYGKSIACATDLADSRQWRSYGGSPGLAGFVLEIKQQLEKESFDQETINDLLGGNIAVHLAVDIKENSI